MTKRGFLGARARQQQTGVRRNSTRRNSADDCIFFILSLQAHPRSRSKVVVLYTYMYVYTQAQSAAFWATACPAASQHQTAGRQLNSSPNMAQMSRACERDGLLRRQQRARSETVCC